MPTASETATLDFVIEATDGGYLLIWTGRKKEHCGDTWHESIEDAEHQAKLSFGIDPDEWQTT